MPSAVIHWTGSCALRTLQEELIGHLGELAERNVRLLAADPPVRPAFSDALASWRREGQPVLPAVIRYGGAEIEGRIRVDPHLLPEEERDRALVAAWRAGALLVPPDRTKERALFDLRRLRLRGIDFQLYDPRGLYPLEDRVSTVFLESETLPCLNGRVARVDGREVCALYDGPAGVTDADWFVSSPSLHLRYYLETWIDLFLTWVKDYFVPDLTYSHGWDGMRDYEAHSGFIEQTAARLGDDEAKRFVLRLLGDVFEREVTDWEGQLAGWKRDESSGGGRSRPDE